MSIISLNVEGGELRIGVKTHTGRHRELRREESIKTLDQEMNDEKVSGQLGGDHEKPMCAYAQKKKGKDGRREEVTKE